MIRMKALGRNPEEVLPTREYAHAQALRAAHEVDPAFVVEMPIEVDDEADTRTDPMRQMILKGAALWLTRAGDDARGYWHIEWDGYEWSVCYYVVADGSGWNLLKRRSLGFMRPGPDLQPYLQSGLLGMEVPPDIADALLQHVKDRVA
jgi:hypothetical protein